MTLTVPYSRTHSAFRSVAVEHELDAFDVRVLVAIYEKDWETEEQELATALDCVIQGVQRSTRRLRSRELIARDRGSGSPGRITARLLTAGYEVARAATDRAVA